MKKITQIILLIIVSFLVYICFASINNSSKSKNSQNKVQIDLSENEINYP